jgi:hypothetical protein
MDMDISNDDALIAELRRIAAEVDGTPSMVSAAAQAAIIARDLDGELAVLVADSRATSDDDLAFESVRGDRDTGSGDWMLSFSGRGVQVDIEVCADCDAVRLVGQLAGAEINECVLEFADGERRQLDVDDIGRFIVPDARHGPMRLKCRSTDGTQVTTTWVNV